MGELGRCWGEFDVMWTSHVICGFFDDGFIVINGRLGNAEAEKEEEVKEEEEEVEEEKEKQESWEKKSETSESKDEQSEERMECYYAGGSGGISLNMFSCG